MLYTIYVCVYMHVFNIYTYRVLYIYIILCTYAHSKGAHFLGDSKELRLAEETAVMLPI